MVSDTNELVAATIDTAAMSLLAVLVMFRGIRPGAVALGVSGPQRFACAVVPTTAPRLASLTLYRWEVTTREWPDRRSA